MTVTYNMNILQSLAAPAQFLLTLNRGEAVDPRKVLGRYVYHHPVYTDRGRGRARPPRTKSTAFAAPTIAAPTGVTDFTRMASRARSALRGIRPATHMNSRIYKGWVEHRRHAPRRKSLSIPRCS